MDVSLDTARTMLAACREVVDAGVEQLARRCRRNGELDPRAASEHELEAYELVSAAAMTTAGEHLLSYGERGPLEALLTVIFAGEATAEVLRRAPGRFDAVPPGLAPFQGEAVTAALAAARSPAVLEHAAARLRHRSQVPYPLDEERELLRETFAAFADERVVPIAQDLHRRDADVPEALIRELADMGCFSLSVPQRYGGDALGDAEGEDVGDLHSMIVVTEELSRGSLGLAGSLVTRSEIVARALANGGTEEQKRRWLPSIASGEAMCAVAVTEPDYGSDIGNIVTTATLEGETYVLNGVKTWCTFAGRAELLMVLARTGTRAQAHRGLSLFVVEKPPYPGHDWVHESEHGGRMSARAIPTLGYRGMHSFELVFEDYRIPAADLVGGEDGEGRGFYLQLDAFAPGRLQTAARAVGVMQAALELAVSQASQRRVFGSALADYQLVQARIAHMGAYIAACRHLTRQVAELLAAGGGQTEAAMAKSLACRSAEWVTREAQQLHGGYGYAEESPVSRLFVDARVLSIFEGAEEVLALRVIAPRLLRAAQAG